MNNIIIADRKIHVNLPRYKRAQIGEERRQGVSGKVTINWATIKGKEISKFRDSAAYKRNTFSYVEAVIYDSVGSEKKEEEKILLNFQSDCALRSRFEKAYVGKVSILGLAFNVQTHLEIEVVFANKVTPLGRNYCLLEEWDKGFISDLINEGKSWWKSWFTEIEKWEVGKVDNSKSL